MLLFGFYFIHKIMSETVHYKGKLTEIKANENETLQQLAERILSEKELDMAEYYRGNHLECLLEQGYYDYVKIEDKIYSVDKEDFTDDRDIFLATKNEDGTIDFQLRYYNGGCGFTEAMDEAIKEIK